MIRLKIILRKAKDTAAWTLLRKIRYFLFYRRRLIPKNLSIVEFLRLLIENDCRFVVLRWFDKLPELWYGDDIDILVRDEDSKKLKHFLTRSAKKGGLPCDAYSVSGKHGLHYMGTPYYPPNKAAEVLKNRVEIVSEIPVPCPEDYFYSLAYHAIYHKGCKSGLPLSSNGQFANVNPEHDFTSILNELAHQLELGIEIDMNSLKLALAKKGWTPSAKMLKKYRQ